jgi:Peptidase family M28
MAPRGDINAEGSRGRPPAQGLCLANRELDILRDALHEHISALAVDIGPRAPSIPDSLVRAANYIHSFFEDAGLTVSEQNYDCYNQRVTNLLGTVPASAVASAYYVVGAHYDTVPSTPGADDNASAVAVLLELARCVQQRRLKAPVLFAAFTLEEPPAHLTAHQGSRIFIRNCRSRGEPRAWGDHLRDGRLYGTAPVLSVSPPLARLSWPRQFHRHYRRLALAPLRTCRSEGLPQEH